MLFHSTEYKPNISPKNACNLCRMAFGEIRPLDCKLIQVGLVPKGKMYKYVIKISFATFAAFIGVISPSAIIRLYHTGLSRAWATFIVSFIIFTVVFSFPFLFSMLTLPIWKYIPATGNTVRK